MLVQRVLAEPPPAAERAGFFSLANSTHAGPARGDDLGEALAGTDWRRPARSRRRWAKPWLSTITSTCSPARGRGDGERALVAGRAGPGWRPDSDLAAQPGQARPGMPARGGGRPCRGRCGPAAGRGACPAMGNPQPGDPAVAVRGGPVAGGARGQGGRGPAVRGGDSARPWLGRWPRAGHRTARRRACGARRRRCRTAHRGGARAAPRAGGCSAWPVRCRSGAVPVVGLAAGDHGLQHREQLRPAAETLRRKAGYPRLPVKGQPPANAQFEFHNEAPRSCHAADRRPVRSGGHHGRHPRKVRPGYGDQGG